MKINFILLFLTIFLFSCQSTEQRLQSLRKEQHEKCGDNKHDGLTVQSQIVKKNRECGELSIWITNELRKLEREGKEYPKCPVCGQDYYCSK